jgi:predicted nucleotidyltransferase
MMKPSDALKRYRTEILQITELYHTRNPRVFGSALHGTDSEASDLDLLVEPLPETTLMDIVRIQNRLQKLTGVTVDVLTPNALPKSFREQVLSEALPV